MKHLVFTVAAATGLFAAEIAHAQEIGPFAAEISRPAAVVGIPPASDGELAEGAASTASGEPAVQEVALLFGRQRGSQRGGGYGRGRRAASDGQQCEFSFGLQSGDLLRDTDETICLNFAPAEIRGVKFEDLNGNGIRDPEDNNPIPGVTINLFLDRNGDGRRQSDQDELIMSTTTGNDGRFVFGDLPPGHYIVEEELGGGLASNDRTRFSVTLNSNDVFGENNDTVFLNFRPAEIHGVKLLDVNGNGVIDPEDTTPIPGVTFVIFRDANGDGRLQDSERDPLQSVQTDQGGRWSFVGLVPGNYIVLEVN